MAASMSFFSTLFGRSSINKNQGRGVKLSRRNSSRFSTQAWLAPAVSPIRSDSVHEVTGMMVNSKAIAPGRAAFGNYAGDDYVDQSYMQTASEDLSSNLALYRGSLPSYSQTTVSAPTVAKTGLDLSSLLASFTQGMGRMQGSSTPVLPGGVARPTVVATNQTSGGSWLLYAALAGLGLVIVSELKKG